MSFELQWQPSALRDLTRLDRPTQERILDAVERLARTGLGDVKLLHGKRRLRHSILRILERFSDTGGWHNDDNYTFDAAAEALCTFYGVPSLQAFSGPDSKERVDTNVARLLQWGYPSEFLDVIEAWFDQQPRRAR